MKGDLYKLGLRLLLDKSLNCKANHPDSFTYSIAIDLSKLDNRDHTPDTTIAAILANTDYK